MSKTISTGAKALAKRLGVSEATILRWHHAGDRLPTPIPTLKLRGVRWLVTDIDAWVKAWNAKHYPRSVVLPRSRKIRPSE